MEPDVVLLSVPNVDWPALIRLTNLAVNPPIRRLDAMQVAPGNVKSFLLILASIAHPRVQNPVELLRKSEMLRGHVGFTFGVSCSLETYEGLLNISHPPLTSTDSVNGGKLCIMTGSLQDWYHFSLSACTHDNCYEIRKIGSKVVFFLESAGFGVIWNGLRKTGLPDTSFILESA